MEWYIWVIIAILAICFAVGLLYCLTKARNARAKKKSEKINSLPEIPIKKRIELLKYDGLKLSEGVLSRLYFSYGESHTQRLLLIKYDDHFKIIKEWLVLWDEDELPYFDLYGEWIRKGDGFLHVYDSEETALKEWHKEIERDGYQEEPLPLNL